ncbi:TatD family hydrolase [Thiohalophilus thiocyanatoxydans]|uniref:TatD DNase family protein n=1 Tax=Thiohalophilus thiocyanatoxydans TaxID=381308 RepID=A0A4R8IPN1_9GAMM|nr:TatD family hydrolase [Thiohalophilus thiocyanatoxydans]TDY02892.1 TatD DNase family protein [Thiohalophilus thiocyanatoxydans]
MYLVDSHCHLDRLDLEPFDGKLEGALQNAREHGVEHMLCVCINMENRTEVLDVARQYDFISASVGVHPNEDEGHDPEVDELVELAADENIVAIGETGLDYFRSEGDLQWQRDRFRRHIAAAKQSDKPLIIHMRDATDDTLRVMQEEGADEIGGVMHCFVEDWETAKKALDLNFHISFSGIVTFKNAKALQEVAKNVPADRYLVETDSPYLAPVPYRGKSNQPAWTRHVAEFIAELRGTEVETIAEQTTHNYFELFRHDRQ